MIQMIYFILSYTFDVHKIPERKNRNLWREDLQKPEKRTEVFTNCSRIAIDNGAREVYSVVSTREDRVLSTQRV